MMKKVFVLVALLITAFSVSSQDMLEAMLTDSDETTNIRSTPGGNVVMKLNSGNMAGRNSICAKHPMKRPTSFSPLTRN